MTSALIGCALTACVATGVVVGQVGGATFVQHAPTARLREVLDRAAAMLGGSDEMGFGSAEPSLAEAALDRLRGGGAAAPDRFDSADGASSAVKIESVAGAAEAGAKRASGDDDDEGGASAKRMKGARGTRASNRQAALALLSHPVMIPLSKYLDMQLTPLAARAERWITTEGPWWPPPLLSPVTPACSLPTL